MKICNGTNSIWFFLNVLAVSGFIVMLLYKSIELLRSFLQQPQHLKKRKKRASRKKNKPLIIPNNKDVVVADNSLKDSGVKTPPKSHSLSKDPAVEPLRQFDYESLKYATHNFSLPVRMSADGLGDVFRANMVSTNEVFAIRRLKPLCFLTIQEFYRELSVLGQVNHPNVAKLIGYSIHRQGCWALVYEYSHGGSLEDYVHGNKPCLDWKKRMKIVQGIAKALQYLHNVMNPPILHCYIEPANIWLDEDFTPKLSAAGVVRMFPTPDRSGFPLDTIGSYVYSASDYRLTGTVNVVSDIYGFGILLLEVISSKKGIFLGGDGKRHMLNDWIKPYFEDGDLAKIVDPRLEGKIEEYELHEACAIAAACLDEQPANRPLIADLVIRMDYLAGYHDS